MDLSIFPVEIQIVILTKVLAHYQIFFKQNCYRSRYSLFMHRSTLHKITCLDILHTLNPHFILILEAWDTIDLTWYNITEEIHFYRLEQWRNIRFPFGKFTTRVFIQEKPNTTYYQVRSV